MGKIVAPGNLQQAGNGIAVSTPVPAGRRRINAPVPAWLKRLLGPVVLLGLWFLLSETGLLSEQQLPAPGTVASKFVELVESGALQENLAISLRRAVVGLVIGVVAGVGLALVSGLSRLGEYLIDAPMQMLRSMPILALVPLAIVWFGIGEEVKVFLVALGVAFPVYLNTHAGICGVDSRFIELADVVGLSKRELIRRVIMPGSLPGFFTGMRFAVSIAWLILVVSEQINADSGIGFLMTQARNFGQTETIVVGLVVYAFLGLISDALVRLAERRALRWRSTLQR